MKGTRPILLVEDDRVDVISVKRAFKDLKISNPLEIVSDGEEGLEFLTNPDNQAPCLILLDINMPRMNGIEFLKVVKSNESLRRIPVIVLTTSKGDRELVDSFDYGVAGYMVKPANYLQFMEVMKAINLYWTISEIPDQGGK
jgi:CheY-like chemotaxis protein